MNVTILCLMNTLSEIDLCGWWVHLRKRGLIVEYAGDVCVLLFFLLLSLKSRINIFLGEACSMPFSLGTLCHWCFSSIKMCHDIWIGFRASFWYKLSWITQWSHQATTRRLDMQFRLWSSVRAATKVCYMLSPLLAILMQLLNAL